MSEHTERMQGQVTFVVDYGSPDESTFHADMNHHPEYYTAICAAMNISAKKNADYAPGDDPLGNFRGVEALGVSANTGLLCRMSDKWARICTWSNRGDLKVDESIEDALMDLGNYCFLMIALLSDQADE